MVLFNVDIRYYLSLFGMSLDIFLRIQSRRIQENSTVLICVICRSNTLNWLF